jgi:hypothetical protein
MTGKNRIRPRPLILAATAAAAMLAALRFGPLAAALVIAAGAAAAMLVKKRPQQASRKPAWTGWAPAVQHQELPAPVEDPTISWSIPPLEQLGPGVVPLSELGIASGVRAQLDGHALGRTKRILEAPDLLQHAAADEESWPSIEQAVQAALKLATSRGIELAEPGVGRLQQALALCAAQGILLAEWRQLEDGATPWHGESAQVRASDAFTLHRLAEATQRRLLPDLFAGIQRRSPDFEVSLLVPYTQALGFWLRLHGRPPRVAAA